MSLGKMDPETGQTIAPMYTLIEGNIMIDASVDKVWPYVLNYTQWQNFSIVKHLSGPKGQEGEVQSLMKDEPGFKTTPYYSRLIKLEPNRRVVWKTFRDNSSYFGIVDFRVEEFAGNTCFSWNLVYEHEVRYTTEEEYLELKRSQYENFSTLTKNIFPRLKAMVEKAG